MLKKLSALLVCLSLLLPQTAYATIAPPGNEITSLPPESIEAEESLPAESSTPLAESLPQSSPTESEPLEDSSSLESTPDSSALPEDSSALGDETEDEPFVGIQPVLDILDANTVIVYTYDELRTALSEDNGYTYIYLGDNITATDARGIEIFKSKTNITLDGQPPGAPEGAYYTYAQYPSSAEFTQIYTSGTSSITNITVQNIIVDGQNHYGIVRMPPALNATVLYQNMVYNGAQPFYGDNCELILRDVDITIRTISGVNAAGEVAEVNRVRLGGRVNIQSNTTSSLFFLKNAGASLTVEQYAQVTLNTNFYFIYAAGIYPSLRVEEGGQLTINGQRGFMYDAGMRFSTFTLESGAGVYFTQSGSVAYSSLRVGSLLLMESGSTLSIDKTGAYPAVELTEANANVVFNNPERVKLHSPAGRAIYFASSGSLHIDTDAINLWQTAASTNVTAADTPTHLWNRTTGEILTVDASYSGTNITGFVTNLASSDPTSGLTSDTFRIYQNTQLMTFGSLPLSVNPVANADLAVTGATAPGAEIYVNYTDINGTATASGNADASGGYSTATRGQQLEVGSSVQVRSFTNSLGRIQDTTVLNAGDFTLSFVNVPDSLVFATRTIPSEAGYIPRELDDWTITVGDTRFNPGGWSIEATAGTLTSTDGNGYILPGALVYVDEGGTATPLSDAPVVVYSYTGTDTGEFDVSWAENEGILLYIDPGEIHSEVTYETNIEWTLLNTP